MVVHKSLASTLCGVTGTLFSNNVTSNLQPKLFNLFKISSASYASDPKSGETEHFLDYNKVVYPPLQPGEPERPAYVCHQKLNIKYQPKKMWYIACLVRGMSVEEAIRQLKQVPRKGALVIIDTINEAVEQAVNEHNVEFRSNLWVAESFIGKGVHIKGMRRHAKMRYGEIRYQYCHYFLRLEEGTPPEQYYWDLPRDGPSLLERYVADLRQRRILNSL